MILIQISVEKLNFIWLKEEILNIFTIVKPH